MNIIDAIKSGRPIRRRMPHEAMRNLNSWICSKHMLDCLSRGDMRPFSKEDLFADDWEIEELMFTEKDFWKAVNGISWTLEQTFKVGELARALGFEVELRCSTVMGPK